MHTPAPFPYYGSKAKIAPWIVEQITPHRIYVEPFAGSCAVLFTKDEARMEIINDLDADIVNFFTVLRDKPDALVDALRQTPYARAEYRRSLDPTPSAVDAVERARRFCVRASMSFSGCAAGQRGFSFSALGKSGGSHIRKPDTFARRVERMHEMAVRLRRVEIECMDAIELCDRWDYPDVTIYCDPPYVGATRSAKVGYAVEGTDTLHTRLLDRLRKHSGEIIVSGYANDLYDSKLSGRGWRRIEKDVNPGSSNTMGARRTEVLWIKRRKRT